MADAVDVPVVNLLSDAAHPCQALADLLDDARGTSARSKDAALAYVGDGNNVAASLAFARGAVGRRARRRVAARATSSTPTSSIGRATSAASIELASDPYDAVRDADAVYTDVWTSMGQEEEAEHAPPRVRGLDGRRRADEGRARATRCSCTACPRTAAKRWRPR